MEKIIILKNEQQIQKITLIIYRIFLTSNKRRSKQYHRINFAFFDQFETSAFLFYVLSFIPKPHKVQEKSTETSKPNCDFLKQGDIFIWSKGIDSLVISKKLIHLQIDKLNLPPFNATQIGFKNLTRFGLQNLCQVNHKLHRLESLSIIFPESAPSQTLRQLMLYVESSQVNFDLICLLAIEKERKLFVHYDKWTNIVNGFIINERENFQEKIQFEKKQVKEFRIIGFLKKQLPHSQIIEQLKISTSHKKHKYVNNQLLSSKKSKNLSIRKQFQSQQLQNKIKEPQRNKKIDNKSSKQKIQQKKLKPLQKRPIVDRDNIKETKTLHINVGTNAQSQATKENTKRALKINIQSEQEYYEKNQFSKIMDSEQRKDTDCSGKKYEEIIIEEAKKPHIHVAKFIEDDEEEALFAKMQNLSKKTEKNKDQTVKNKQQIFPQLSKKQNNSKKKELPGTAVTQKGGLMSWLNKK